MQREPASDQELNLKKRARRRLVGAIALVLLMIIVLPMILKDRAATSPQEKITITLPGEPASPDASGFDSNIVPAELPKEAGTASPSPAETGAGDVKANPDVTDSEAAPSPPASPTATVKQNETKTASKETPSEDKKTEKPKDEEIHHFYVQIGVFSDAANVKQLQGKLSDLGYKSNTEKVNTDKGQKIRLKTQIFNDRNEAAIALQNIKDAGLTGMVVSQ